MPHRLINPGWRETLISSAGLIVLNLAVIPIFMLPFTAGAELSWPLVIFVLCGAVTQIPIVHYQLNFAWITVINILVFTSVGYVLFIHDELASSVWSRAIFSELMEIFQADWSSFATLVPPIEPTLGFTVPLAAFIWLILAFSFQATVRFHSAVSAVIPLVMLLIVLIVLSRTTPNYAASLLAISGFLIYGFAQRGRRYLLMSRLAPEPLQDRLGLGTGMRALAVAFVVGAIGLGVLPQLESHFDVRSMRRSGAPAAPRTVNSPMVGLRNLLGPQSNQELFTVDASQPAYWRLTALDEYDSSRDLWVSTSRYTRPLEGSTTNIVGEGTTIIQDYNISGLSGIWLPTAFVAQSLEATFEVRVNSDTDSFIVASDATPDGGTTASPLRNQQYRVESTFHSQDMVIANDQPFFPDPNAVTTSSNLSVETQQLLRLSVGYSNAVNTSSTEIGFLRALQNWFRTDFRYNENVNFSRASDPLAAFLSQGEGFCQQFASAFALIAEAHGFEVRVAVGFTPGEAAVNDARSDTTRYVVKGKYAHAWPEVHVQGVGWVPFEPTPSRGNPLAEQITGVAAAQHDPSQDEPGSEAEPSQSTSPDENSIETTTTTALQPDERNVPTPPEAAQPNESVNPRAEQDPDAVVDTGRDTPRTLAIVGIIMLLGSAVWIYLWKRRQNAQQARGDSANHSTRQWDRVTAHLAKFGVVGSPSSTPLQLARQLRIIADDSSAPAAQQAAMLLEQAARLETFRRFGPVSLSEDEAQELARLADEIISLDPLVVGVDGEDRLDTDRLEV